MIFVPVGNERRIGLIIDSRNRTTGLRYHSVRWISSNKETLLLCWLLRVLVESDNRGPLLPQTEGSSRDVGVLNRVPDGRYRWPCPVLLLGGSRGSSFLDDGDVSHRSCVGSRQSRKSLTESIRNGVDTGRTPSGVGHLLVSSPCFVSVAPIYVGILLRLSVVGEV